MGVSASLLFFHTLATVRRCVMLVELPEACRLFFEASLLGDIASTSTKSTRAWSSEILGITTVGHCGLCRSCEVQQSLLGSGVSPSTSLCPSAVEDGVHKSAKPRFLAVAVVNPSEFSMAGMEDGLWAMSVHELDRGDVINVARALWPSDVTRLSMRARMWSSTERCSMSPERPRVICHATHEPLPALSRFERS